MDIPEVIHNNSAHMQDIHFIYFICILYLKQKILTLLPFCYFHIFLIARYVHVSRISGVTEDTNHKYASHTHIRT